MGIEEKLKMDMQDCRCNNCADCAIADLTKKVEKTQSKLKRLIAAAKHASCQFALMADGEGEDYKVYMQMSESEMRYLDRAIKEIENE